MGVTRRKFLGASAGVGAEIVTAGIWRANVAVASGVDERVVGAPSSEWMANTPASAYRAYRSKAAKTPDATTWVQIDLGKSRAIDLVKVYPANERGVPGHDEHYAGEGFPVRFKIECCDDSEFHHPVLIVDHTGADYPNPKGHIEQYAAKGVAGRYVRLTATRLMRVEGGGHAE